MTEGTEQAASGRALDPASFGRVADDGTVYVRTPDGERVVGQVPDVPAAEALAFFTRRYEALELEVSPAGAPDRLRGSVARRRRWLDQDGQRFA